MENKSSLYVIFIKATIFVMLLALVLYKLNTSFLPKYTYQNSPWPTTGSYNSFYQMKNNSVDVLFLGSSVAVNAFCPQEIYNDYGIRSYNLGSEQQSIFLSYYWLKEALRYQHPKVVVLDLLFLMTKHKDDPLNTTEGLTRKCIDPMKWSPVKVEAVRDIARRCHTQSEMSYYLTNIRFHSRWSSGLGRSDFDKQYFDNAELKGWNTMLYYGGDKFKTFTPQDEQAQTKVNELQKAYLYKIGKLCQDNQIKLVLTDLPHGQKDMNDGLNNVCQQIADDLGVPYYNFNKDSLYQALDAKLPKESAVGHANYWGAMKISQYIGKVLQEEYHIQPVVDEQYENTRSFFAQVQKDANLQYVTDFDDYLDAIHDPTYVLFFSIRDEGTSALSETDMEKLRALGIQTNLLGKYRHSWCAVVDPAGDVTEQVSPDKRVEAKGWFGKDKIPYQVISAGWNTKSPVSVIRIGNRDYAHNSRGINIVVYDTIGQTVIDSVTFDTCHRAEASRNWFKDMSKHGISPTFNTRW